MVFPSLEKVKSALYLTLNYNFGIEEMLVWRLLSPSNPPLNVTGQEYVRYSEDWN